METLNATLVLGLMWQARENMDHNDFRQPSLKPDICKLTERMYYTIENQDDSSVLAADPNSDRVISSVPTGSEIEKWWVKGALKFPDVLYFVFNKDDRALTARKESNGEVRVLLAPFKGSREQMFQPIGDSDHCVLKLAEEELYLVSPRLGIGAPLLPIAQKVVVSSKMTSDNVYARKFAPIACDPHYRRRYRLIHRATGGQVGFEPGDELVHLFPAAQKRDIEYFTISSTKDNPTVFIIRSMNGQNLTIKDHVDRKGALLVRKGQHGGTCQQFYFKPSPDGKYCSIASLSSRRYLAPIMNKFAPKSSVIAQQELVETLEGQWLMEPENDGKVPVVPRGR